MKWSSRLHEHSTRRCADWFPLFPDAERAAANSAFVRSLMAGRYALMASMGSGIHILRL
jgi:hypothetical protein